MLITVFVLIENYLCDYLYHEPGCAEHSCFLIDYILEVKKKAGENELFQEIQAGKGALHQKRTRAHRVIELVNYAVTLRVHIFWVLQWAHKCVSKRQDVDHAHERQ